MSQGAFVIVGGASGIGAALCRLLASQGATVIVADCNTEKAEQLAREIDGRAIAVDITSQASVDNLISAAGPIAVLINSAGILPSGNAPEDWVRTLDVNLYGAVRLTLAAYRQMVEQGYGHIVNVASASGLYAPPLQAPYVTSKYGVVGLSLGLRAEAACHGVRISVACPGNVATPMLAGHHLSPFTPAVTPEYAARKILEGIRRNTGVIVFPGYARCLWWLERLSPYLSECLRAQIVKRGNAKTRN